MEHFWENGAVCVRCADRLGFLWVGFFDLRAGSGCQQGQQFDWVIEVGSVSVAARRASKFDLVVQFRNGFVLGRYLRLRRHILAVLCLW